MAKSFFQKYLSEWQEIKWIIHQHWVRIIDKIFFYLIWLVFIPVFLYYFSDSISYLIPLYIFEIYLFLVYAKIIYELFNRYNDVRIITNESIADLDWALFKTNIKTVNYQNIEWIEIDQNWIWDKILNKWDIIIHKVWEDSFILKDARIPYKAIDEIEKISKEVKENQEDNWEKEKFDLILDALSWVLDDYLDRKWIEKKSDTKKEEKINKALERWWTLDLRGE